MYKFFLYTILIICYLGLAKALSPTEHGIQYLQNEKGFSKLSSKNQTTFILIDVHATGFLIQTYYQKYRIVSDYGDVEELVVRTSKEFAKKHLNHVGLSLYRKNDLNEEIIPLPPGSLFIGNPAYGFWRTLKDGRVVWRFYKSFKNFPQYLGWGNFRPDNEFYQRMRSAINLNQAFFGPNNEFGPKGSVTKQGFPHFFREDRKQKVELKSLLMNYLKENF